MSSVLPPLMVALAASFLVAVLYALWQSLRALLVEGATRANRRSDPAAAREALLREKETLLRAIREAEMDRDVGKLSERDFERLNARFRARAREVLGALEAQVAPHRDRARALISGDASRDATQADGPAA